MFKIQKFDHRQVLGSLALAVLLFTGCSDSTQEAEVTQNSTRSVAGKSSLSQATVCIDANADMRCNADEVSTTSGEDGTYLLEYSESGADVALLATGGFNLITLKENHNRLYRGSLEDEATHNINTFTTLIQEHIDNGMGYEEARADIAARFGLESALIDQDPLELLQDSQTQLYFLTLRTIEDYVDNQDQNQSVSRSAELQNTTVISVEDADEAVQNSNIFDFDLDAYLERLHVLFQDFFTGLFEWLGFGGDDGDNGDYTFDESTLDPYVEMLYTNDTNASSEEKNNNLWSLTVVMRSDDQELITKNYNDLNYVLEHTRVAEVQKGVVAVYAIVSTQKATKLMLESLDRDIFYEKWSGVDVGALMFFSVVEGVAGVDYFESRFRYENAYLYEDYFQNSPNIKHKDNIANAMVYLSKEEGLNMMLDYIDAHYISSDASYDSTRPYPQSYTQENILADRLVGLFHHYKSDLASSVLVEYYDQTDDEILKKKLRNAFANIANQVCVEKL